MFITNLPDPDILPELALSGPRFPQPEINSLMDAAVTGIFLALLEGGGIKRDQADDMWKKGIYRLQTITSPVIVLKNR